MGIGVVPATRKVLDKTGLSLQDFDVIELNEAFAAQVLACDRELKLDHDKLNPNGGAIALGHPIGMTGARIVLTCAYEMRERELALGLATLCISRRHGHGDRARAGLVERVHSGARRSAPGRRGTSAGRPASASPAASD